jgi:hypothetical protein
VTEQNATALHVTIWWVIASVAFGGWMHSWEAGLFMAGALFVMMPGR